MEQILEQVLLVAVLTPLAGCLITGLGCRYIPRTLAHWITIAGIAVSFIASLYIANKVVLTGLPAFEHIAYTWGQSGAFQFNIGFLFDKLTAIMMVTVTFVSLIVHIYSIGYMAEDEGYQRFFSYMSLFTFMMLMLVTANNVFQLFFGWEGVGLVSYLLIGFWFHKESAVQGSLKAFLVNRVGDFAFLLGIAGILDYFGTLNYWQVFDQASNMAGATVQIFPGHEWLVISVICILLFVGAIGKSAQIPLHVWLPESMEGPTPISALIHAATMVTAGVFMLARLSPMFELSETALTCVLVIGSLTALLTGCIAIVQNDIKRVIAYSTMSQLGYMVAAAGASAYSASIFHLVTHACFKSLLFLAAGSVIVALHHEQDMRRMGNLKQYMPITYLTFLVGALALAAVPPFAGYFSKEPIIEAARLSTIAGSSFAYACLLAATFITAFYIFRAFFMTFHGSEKMEATVKRHAHETSAVMTTPLVILAIPSIVIGAILVRPMLYSAPGYLTGVIAGSGTHNVMTRMAAHYPGNWHEILASLTSLPFWLAIAGIISAWLCYVKYPQSLAMMTSRIRWLYIALRYKLGFDMLYDWLFVRGGRKLANMLYRVADLGLIDNMIVLGSGRLIVGLSRLGRRSQSGYLYHYAFAMILGLLVFLCWLLLFRG